MILDSGLLFRATLYKGIAFVGCIESPHCVFANTESHRSAPKNRQAPLNHCLSNALQQRWTINQSFSNHFEDLHYSISYVKPLKCVPKLAIDLRVAKLFNNMNTCSRIVQICSFRANVNILFCRVCCYEYGRSTYSQCHSSLYRFSRVNRLTANPRLYDVQRR